MIAQEVAAEPAGGSPGGTDGVVASAARSLCRPAAGVGTNVTETGVPRAFGIA
jgi:hypothetical protein